MDRTQIIAGLELIADSPEIPLHPNVAREAADFLRADERRPHDLEELSRLQTASASQLRAIAQLHSRGLELRASDEKKAERIEKLVKVASGMLGLIDQASGLDGKIGRWKGSVLRCLTIEALPDETEQPFGNTARDVCEKLADSVQQCATDIDTRNPSIYNAALTWQRLEELRARAIRGCLLAGPGRGDCDHFVGLPEEENRDTTDEYGRPHGWCQVCWLAERERRMCNKVRELSAAAVEFVRLDSMPHTLPNAGNARIARDKLLELAGGEGAT